MKVKELIEMLKKQDPEKDVMIQQGEEFDYMIAYSVREKQIVDMTNNEDLPEQSYVVIDFE